MFSKVLRWLAPARTQLLSKASVHYGFVNLNNKEQGRLQWVMFFTPECTPTNTKKAVSAQGLFIARPKKSLF